MGVSFTLTMNLDTVFICVFIVETSLVQLLESEFRNGISLVLDDLVLDN